MTDFEDRMNYLHSIDNEFDEILLNSFKGLFIDGHGNGGPNFHATLTKKNRFFENTDYFYNEQLDFIHLTTIPNLLSILNSRAFRFYNLHSSKDPDEYNYAGDLLHLTNDEIANCKEYLYTFSFCPLTELNNKKIWEVYGNNFQGAALTFKILNDPKEWVNYHLAEIIYDDHSRFETYFNNLKTFQEKYQITAKCDLSKLIAFHKTPKWNEEKEVRLTTYFPYEHMDEYFKYSKTEFRIESNRNRITRYIELPIWVDNGSFMIKGYKPELDRSQSLATGFFDNSPKIQLTGIILGENCGIQPLELARFTTALSHLVENNYGYTITVDNNLYRL